MRSRQSEMMKAKWADPEYRARVAAKISASLKTPETRAILRAASARGAKKRRENAARRKHQEIEPEMIVVTHGTTFITAEAFADRYRHAPVGASFRYATGDLASVCQTDPSAKELRELVQHMSDRGEIVLTQRRRADLNMPNNCVAYEYLATRRQEQPA